MRYLGLALAVWVACALGNAAAADETALPSGGPQEKPVVALVLGGGGALGLSHVGVIAELEAAGIDPDIVVGTSMGAVIGSLYASGYTPDELAEVASSLDWPQLFRDSAPRRRLAFRRKEEDLSLSTSFKLSVGEDGLRLPGGLIKGRRLKSAIGELLNQQSLTNDFDQLPRRFRAVATDIETFEPVVLSEGDLPSAVFSSMAVPGLLPPQVHGGKTLIDGGLAANVPVSVAREMGADIIIAVNLSTQPQTADEIENIFNVLGQIAAYLTLKNAEEDLATLTDKDVLISPDLDGFSTIDFGRADELIVVGREAMAPHQAVLNQLGNRLSSSSPTLVRSVSKSDEPRIAEIKLENNTSYPDEYILGELNQPVGELLDNAKLATDLDQIYGTDEFGNITYRLEQRADGDADLVVRLSPTAVGDTYARLGLEIASDIENETDFNIVLSGIRRNVTGRGGEVRTGLRIGDQPTALVEFYQPFDANHTWFYSTIASVNRQRFTLFDDGQNSLAELNVDSALLGLAGGRVFSRQYEVRVGLDQTFDRVSSRTGLRNTPGLPNSSNTTSAFLLLSADTLDNAFFPRSGVLGSIQYREVLESESAALSPSFWDGAAQAAIPLRDGALLMATEFGFSIDNDTFAIQTPDGLIEFAGTQTLGGPGRLSGIPIDSLQGRHKVFGSIGYYQPILGADKLIGSPIFLGGTFEAGNVYQDTDEIGWDSVLLGGTVFVGTRTPIGPINLGLGFTEQDVGVFLRVGPTF